MVKAKYGQIVSDVRGSIAGACFSRGNSGTLIRSKTSNRNKKTISQNSNRVFFTYVNQIWRTLSKANVNAWNEQAKLISKNNIFGDKISNSGCALFNSCNINLLTINESIILWPPKINPVFSFSEFLANVDVGAGTAILTFTPAVDIDTKVLVYATPPIGTGITNAKNFYRLIAVLDNLDASPYDCASEYTTRFGGLGSPGQQILFKLIPIDKNTGLAGGIYKPSAASASIPYVFGRDVTLPGDSQTYLCNRIHLAGFNATENAQIQNYSFYTWQSAAAQIKIALYDVAFNLVANSVSDSLSPPLAPAWRDFTITGAKPIINSGNLYYFAMWSSVSNTFLKYAIGGVPLRWRGLPYTGNFPDPLTGLAFGGACSYSVYANCIVI